MRNPVVWFASHTLSDAKANVPAGYMLTQQSRVDRTSGQRMWEAVVCDDPEKLMECRDKHYKAIRGEPGTEERYAWAAQQQAENVLVKEQMEHVATRKAQFSEVTQAKTLIVAGAVITIGIIVYMYFRGD